MNSGRHTRWDEIRGMLTGLLAWLDATRQWAEAATVGESSGDHAQTVPFVGSATAEPVSDGAPILASGVAAGDALDVPNPDLFALLMAMTALRQEVKLQTRASRHDREQAAQALEQLSGAVTQLESGRQEAIERRNEREAYYVHVDTLVDLHDALSRAERQASHMVASAVTTLRDWSAGQDEQDTGEVERPEDDVVEENQTGSESKTRAFGRLRGWLGRPAAPPAIAPPPVDSEPPTGAHDTDKVLEQRRMRTEAAQMADRLEGIATGYMLSLQRLERALVTCGIEPTSCLGEPVDPELMEVVQIVSDDTQPSGTVYQEVRRGYRRHGQVYRFAQVVVTRAHTACGPQSQTEES